MAHDDARTDAQLIEDARNGDVEAFALIYHRYRDWVVRLAHRFTGDREASLEALQETFAYLLAKLPGLHLSAGMTTFLYPVVKHTAIAAVRKNRRYQAGGHLSDDIRVTIPVDQSETRQDLAVVLAILPDKQRETLLMRFVDGMTLEEIAGALEIPLGTVKSRIHNALSTLRQDDRTRAYFQ